MSLAKALQKLETSEPSDLFSVANDLATLAHDDATAKGLLLALVPEWEKRLASDPRKALVVANAAFLISDDWNRRWPLGDWQERIARSLDVEVEADHFEADWRDAVLDWDLACFLRDLPRAELAAILERVGVGDLGPRSYLRRLGGAKALACVGHFAKPRHETRKPEDEPSFEAVSAAIASLDEDALPGLHGALATFAMTLGHVATAAVVVRAIARALDAKKPVDVAWLHSSRWHDTLSDLLCREHKAGDVADALAALLPRLESSDRAAALERSANARTLTYGHAVGREEPSVLAGTSKAIAELAGDTKTAGARIRTAARILEALGPSVLPYVDELFAAATPDGALAFSYVARSERTAARLVKLLGHAHKEIKHETIAALRVFGPLADAALAEGARSKKKAIREASAAVLAERSSGEKDPIESLVAALGPAELAEVTALLSAIGADASTKERALAATAYEKLGPAFVAAAYRAYLGNAHSWEAERPVAFALEHVAKEGHLRPEEALSAVLVHVATHLPAIDDYHIEKILRPMVPFAKTIGAALAEAIGKKADLTGKIPLYEGLLDKAKETIPSSFWAAALADGSKKIRALAAAALGGRNDATDAVLAHLSSKKGDVRSAAAELLAKEGWPGTETALRQALAAEKDPKVAVWLERALAKVASDPKETTASGPGVVGAAGEAPTNDDPRGLLRSQKKGKLPKFLAQAPLPWPAWKDGTALDEAERSALVTRLANESVDLEDPVARTVRKALEPTSAMAFGDAIHEAWLAAGRDSKQKWAVFQLGVLGSAKHLDELAARLGAEASSGGHHYAAWTLEALERHGRVLAACGEAQGVDVGLSWLLHWSRAATSDSLGHRARDLVTKARSSRGLDDAALTARTNAFIASDAADRAIPKVDLETSFTFGGHTFVPVVHETKLALRGENGAVVPLPKKSSKEDAAAYSSEKHRFEGIAAHAAHVLAWESSRLELAMVSRRVWRAEAFLALLDHALVKHLLAGLVAKAGDVLFRPSLDGLLTVDYGTISRDELRAAGTVTLPHRIDLDTATIAAWGTHLAESKVFAPFDQLGREVHIDPSDLTIDTSRTMKPQALSARLIESRWQHGRPEDAGIFYTSSRLFAGYGVRAILRHAGLGITTNDFQTEPVGLESIGFEDVYGVALELTDVPSVVRSEVARDLHALLR